MKMSVKVLVTQLCLTLCDPMDYSLPHSSVHGIFQARVLGWVSISFSALNAGKYNLHLTVSRNQCDLGTLQGIYQFSRSLLSFPEIMNCIFHQDLFFSVLLNCT